MRLQRIDLAHHLGSGHTTVQLSATTTTAEVCTTIAARRGITTQLALLVEESMGTRRLVEDAVVMEEKLSPHFVRSAAAASADAPRLQECKDGEKLKAEPLPTMLSPKGTITEEPRHRTPG